MLAVYYRHSLAEFLLPLSMRGFRRTVDLSRSTADEEPLVYGAVDLLWEQVLVGRQRRQLVRRDTAWRVSDSQVGPVSLSASCPRNIHLDVLGLVTYVEMLPGWVLPVMSLSQASAHSRTTSMAYLVGVSIWYIEARTTTGEVVTSCSCIHQ